MSDEYYCEPKYYGDPAQLGLAPKKNRFYLVTVGRVCGVFTDWTLVSALVQCPGGTQKGHSTWEACVAEWQIHCARGSHSHPRDPLAEHYEDEGRFDKSVIEQMKDISLSDAAAPSRLKMMKDMSPNSKSKLQRDLKLFAGPNLGHPQTPSKISVTKPRKDLKGTDSSSLPSSSSVSSLTSSSTGIQETHARHFAIRTTRGNRDGVVVSDRARANKIYKKFLTAGDGPELLTTGSLDVAQAFLLEKDLD